MEKDSSKTSSLKVLFYLPNIVGYVRVVLLISGLCLTPHHPMWACALLTLSGLLDMLDGFLARLLNQSSKFGAIFDYALDRATLACFLFFIAYFYPFLWIPCAIVLGLDIMSHFFHLQASQVQNKTSHKIIQEGEPRLIRLYYSNRFVLTATCAAHDLFLGALFLYKFYPNAIVLICMAALFPGFLFKTIVHIAKIIRSSSILISEAG